MGNTNPVLLFLSALLLSAAAARTPTRPAAVLDVSGQSLRRGVEYYVLPVYRGRGGGLTLAGRNGTTCPLNVAQEAPEVADGLPLTFRPADAREAAVRLSADANVEFAASTACVQSTVWRLGGADGAAGRRYVTAGGVAGSPGVGTVSNWFKIERDGERDYKLVFCPTVCSFCKVVCGDLGVFYEDGRRWLALTDQPLPVMFKKA
uniref:Miraculin n=1 Tax=Anthurium amnicola TaxID=1678845 RepID=A0A1D1YCI2_9ARAE